mgnify:CR=1 FL=1
MLSITATEFKQNLSKYMHLSLSEDVLVISNGKPLTLLTNPKKDKYDEFLSICGIVKDYDYEKALDERENKRWESS